MMRALEPTWGSEMTFAEICGRAFERAASAVDVAREATQERLVVVAGGGGMPLRGMLLAILLAFIGGCGAGIWWDMSGFRQFQEAAEVLRQRAEAKNAELAKSLDELKQQFDAKEVEHAVRDQLAAKVLNGPASRTCPARTAAINAIFREGNR